MLNAFSNYMVTYDRLLLANEKAVLNPCPPFFRGEEVSADAIDSKYFVGYEFKKYLLEIQQAIIMYNMLS
jgi:ornithine carbamoyltransferase